MKSTSWWLEKVSRRKCRKELLCGNSKKSMKEPKIAGKDCAVPSRCIGKMSCKKQVNQVSVNSQKTETKPRCQNPVKLLYWNHTVSPGQLASDPCHAVKVRPRDAGDAAGQEESCQGPMCQNRVLCCPLGDVVGLGNPPTSCLKWEFSSVEEKASLLSACWEPPERELSDASSEFAHGLKQ